MCPKLKKVLLKFEKRSIFPKSELLTITDKRQERVLRRMGLPV
jgi:hypothetical protein